MKEVDDWRRALQRRNASLTVRSHRCVKNPPERRFNEGLRDGRIRRAGERFIVYAISSMCEERFIDVEETNASWMFSEMNLHRRMRNASLSVDEQVKY